MVTHIWRIIEGIDTALALKVVNIQTTISKVQGLFPARGWLVPGLISHVIKDEPGIFFFSLLNLESSAHFMHSMHIITACMEWDYGKPIRSQSE